MKILLELLRFTVQIITYYYILIFINNFNEITENKCASNLKTSSN